MANSDDDKEEKDKTDEDDKDKDKDKDNDDDKDKDPDVEKGDGSDDEKKGDESDKNEERNKLLALIQDEYFDSEMDLRPEEMERTLQKHSSRHGMKSTDSVRLNKNAGDAQPEAMSTMKMIIAAVLCVVVIVGIALGVKFGRGNPDATGVTTEESATCNATDPEANCDGKNETELISAPSTAPTPVPIPTGPPLPLPEVVSGEWKLIGSFTDSAATDDKYGSFVASGGDLIAIGVPGPELDDEKGMVIILKKTAGDEFENHHIIESSDFDIGVSGAVSSDGSRLALGAPEQNRVLIYDTSNWDKVGEVKGSDNNRMGSSLSFSSDGSRLAVGAPASAEGGTGSGMVRVLYRDGSTWNSLGGDIEGGYGDKLGVSVILSNDGNTMYVGAEGYDMGSGVVKIFEYDASTTEWSKVGEITGTEKGDEFGSAMSFVRMGDGKHYLAVGAIGYDITSDITNAGQCTVYDVTNPASYTNRGSSKTGTGKGQKFGHSVVLNGKRMAVGSPYIKDDKGVVRLYEFDNDWADIGEIEGGSGMRLGNSIALDEDLLIIGATGEENSRGEVYIFKYDNTPDS